MSKLVLVTGANGFVGTNTALYFLQRGWRVRGAVRSAEKQNALNSNRSLKPFYDKGALETVIIPSREDETAWKAALRGVDGVAHVAASTGSEFESYEALLKGIKANVRMLVEACVDEGSVEALAFASNGFTACDAKPLIPEGIEVWWQQLAGRRFDESVYYANNDDAVLAAIDVKSSPFGSLVWYAAAQMKASLWAEERAKEMGSNLAISAMVIDTVVGPPLQLSNVSEIVAGGGASLSALRGLVSGAKNSLPPSVSCGRVSVTDVAQGFYQAITRSRTGRYILTGFTASNHELAHKLVEARPDLKDLVPAADLADSPLRKGHMVMDNAKSQSELGVQYKTAKEAVVEAVEYLEQVGYLAFLRR